MPVSEKVRDKEKEEAIGEVNVKSQVNTMFGDFIWSNSPN